MRKTPAAADGDGSLPAVLPQFDAEAAAAELVEQGQLLQQLPCLADKRAILMRATKLSSTIVCMPQERNAAGRMFGGFLMKCAFELAFATAYTSGGCRPLFKEVDEIAFLQPVGE
jgi:acyl-coenzyme A thioesterase 9